MPWLMSGLGLMIWGYLLFVLVAIGSYVVAARQQWQSKYLASLWSPSRQRPKLFLSDPYITDHAFRFLYDYVYG